MHSNKKIRKTEIEQKLVEIQDYIEQVEESLPSDEEEFFHSGIKKHGMSTTTSHRLVV